MSANLATSSGVSNVLTPSDHRLMIQEPTKLSSVLPVAIAVEVKIDPAVVNICEERRNEERGPNPISKQEDGRQRKSRCWPDWARIWMY
jgi:hypothetical protein